MRVLHTSDWHLGATLNEFGREYEHERFLAWLLHTLGQTAADALLVAGDVFDSTNPPASAQRQLYQFLASLRSRHPSVQVVIIGGNHDSASRLDAPGTLLETLGVRVVGGLTRDAEGRLEADRLVVELTGRDGQRAWCVAIPHLRAADLPVTDPGGGMVGVVAALYEEAFAPARARRRSGEALLTTGHLFVSGSQVSEKSERRLYVGGLDGVPASIFPVDACYVALGHLHLAQKVAGLEHVRYSGSPIPLSVTEAGYRHQVCLVEIEGGQLRSVESIPVPRAVEVVRVPEEGELELEELEARLGELPALEGPIDAPDRPYLHVCLRLASPVPELRRRLELALEGKQARLTTISTTWSGSSDSLADASSRRSLEDIEPEEVFRQYYALRHEGEAPDDLVALYRELLIQLDEEERP